jgi:hypothetical protein
MSRIRVTINHLVLNGFEAGDQRPLVEGLQEELLKALANPATRAEWAHSHSTPVLRLRPLPFEVGPSGRRKFASSLAQSIVRGLNP